MASSKVEHIHTLGPNNSISSIHNRKWTYMHQKMYHRNVCSIFCLFICHSPGLGENGHWQNGEKKNKREENPCDEIMSGDENEPTVV